jgi:hypothetical protein
LSIFVRSLLPFCFIATSYVAYLSRIYSPSPGLGQASKTALFPSLHSRVRRLKHFARYELAAVPLEPRVRWRRAHRGLHRYVSPRIPSRIHTHTLSLPSLSPLALPTRTRHLQRGQQPAHTAPIHSCVCSRLGNAAGSYIMFLNSNSRAGHSPAI